MRRTQIYLDEDQKRALRAIAADKDVNVSELVRGAIDRLLGDELPLVDRRSRFDALQARIEAALPRDPTDEEIASALTRVRARRKVQHGA